MNPSAESDPALNERASWRAWSAVVVVTILNIYAFVDRAILSLLVQPIKTDLDLSDTQMGLLLGAAFVAMPLDADAELRILAQPHRGLAQRLLRVVVERRSVEREERIADPAAFASDPVRLDDVFAQDVALLGLRRHEVALRRRYRDRGLRSSRRFNGRCSLRRGDRSP